MADRRVAVATIGMRRERAPNGAVASALAPSMRGYLPGDHAARRQSRDRLRHRPRTRHRARGRSRRPKAPPASRSRLVRPRSSTTPKRRFARAGSRRACSRCRPTCVTPQQCRHLVDAHRRRVRARRRAREQRLRARASSRRRRAADLDDWRATFDVNLFGTLQLTQAVDAGHEAAGRRRDRHDQQHGDAEADAVSGRLRGLEVGAHDRDRAARARARRVQDPRQLGVHGMDVGAGGRELSHRGGEAAGHDASRRSPPRSPRASRSDGFPTTPSARRRRSS